jgi:hypothetical protein
MNQHFTLRPGKWKVARRDGKKEIVESDGTYSLDMETVCWVICLVPTAHPDHSAEPQSRGLKEVE